jgi:hypothetical protein
VIEEEGGLSGLFIVEKGKINVIRVQIEIGEEFERP